MTDVLVTDWFTVRPNYIIRGKIHTKNMTYTIEELDLSQVTIGKSKDIRSAKSRVRQLLLESGVLLNSEVRRN